MSRVVKTFCDCCGNELDCGEINGNLLCKSLFLTVVAGATKTRYDYCYACGEKIAKAMEKEVRKTFDNRNSEDSGNA